MMSIRLVWPFVALARQHGNGAAVEDVHERLGLTPAEFNDPDTRIPVQLAADQLKYAVAKSGCRDLGLLAARLVDSAHLGISEYLARSRPTLREALESGAHYVRLIGDGAYHRLDIEGDLAYARVWFDPQLVLHEATYEFVLALGVLRARRLTRLPELTPLEVHFPHPEPADTTRHRELFGCPCRFGMPITQVILSADALRAPLADAEPALGRLLERQADAMLRDLPDSTALSDRVRSLLQGEADLRRASVSHIARRLGMSVRTLARKLNDENSSYRELIDDTRKQAALRELSRGSRPITEIAYQLGFANTQSFHRAFRRWTGGTAARYREQTQKAQS